MYLWAIYLPVELCRRREVLGDCDPRDGPAAHLREELVRVEGEADGDQIAAGAAERRGGRAEEVTLSLMSPVCRCLLSKRM